MRLRGVATGRCCDREIAEELGNERAGAWLRERETSSARRGKRLAIVKTRDIVRARTRGNERARTQDIEGVQGREVASVLGIGRAAQWPSGSCVRGQTARTEWLSWLLTNALPSCDLRAGGDAIRAHNVCVVEQTAGSRVPAPDIGEESKSLSATDLQGGSMFLIEFLGWCKPTPRQQRLSYMEQSVSCDDSGYSHDKQNAAHAVTSNRCPDPD